MQQVREGLIAHQEVAFRGTAVVLEGHYRCQVGNRSEFACRTWIAPELLHVAEVTLAGRAQVREAYELVMAPAAGQLDEVSELADRVGRGSAQR